MDHPRTRISCTLRQTFSLPNITWLFCEDGQARPLKPAETSALIRQAQNVLGWRKQP